MNVFTLQTARNSLQWLGGLTDDPHRILIQWLSFSSRTDIVKTSPDITPREVFLMLKTI